MKEVRCEESMPPMGEHSKLGGIEERKSLVLDRARATIKRVESMERAAPVEYEEFDLDAYLRQFPRPLR